MGVVPFFVGLIGSAVVVLILATFLGIAIAFFLPMRYTKAAYILVEWATALSSAAPLVLILTLQSTQTPHINNSHWYPYALGSVISLSFLPLGIILLLRVLEPRKPVLLACRSLGIRLRQTITIFGQSTGTDLLDVLGLFTARLLADSAAVMWLLYQLPALAPAVLLSVIAMYLYRRSLFRLTYSMGIPVYPPLFGALPELPSGLHIAPHLTRLAKVLIIPALVVLVGLAMVEYLGVSVLQVVGSAWKSAVVFTPTASQLMLTLQSVTLLMLLVGLGLWLWLKLRLIVLHRYAVSMAALSPILFAIPGVYLFQSNTLAGWVVCTIGVFVYIIIQYSAARTMQAVVIQRTLVPGEMATAAAMRALGLPFAAAQAHGPSSREMLSASAIWFSSATVAIVIIGLDTVQAAASAVIWGLLAGVLQAAAMQVSRIRPCAVPSTIPLSATLEALSHDTT